MYACSNWQNRSIMDYDRREEADVLIVGTGAAGLYCALKLPAACKVVMITKDCIENSDSYLAQGGICMLRSPEDYETYYEDTMRAGHYENNPEAVRIMIDRSSAIIEDLITYQVNFSRDGDQFAFTREGAHSRARILHHDDITGKEITSKLVQAVMERQNVKIFENEAMVDLLCDKKRCYGVVTEDEVGDKRRIYARYTVLATGGLGGLFRNTTNHAHLVGDSLEIALKYNIPIDHINYIQIHPTTLYTRKPGRAFLISESVRGEGGILLNKAGNRFVDELLPRDQLTEAIEIQKKKDGLDYVRLSLSHLEPDRIIDRFPNIYQKCLDEGYDITKEPIPVTPAQHYFMGGLRVDLDSKTEMDGLYAIGETSCNGVHGANRLASNSLLEALVFAERAALSIGVQTDRDIDYDSIEYCIVDNSEDSPQRVAEAIRRKDPDFYEKWLTH